MSRRRASPWMNLAPANDNDDATAGHRGNRTQSRTVICDLPSDPGIIAVEVDLIVRFFDLIVTGIEPANDNEITRGG